MQALSDQNAKRQAIPEEVNGVMADIKSLLMKIEEVCGGDFRQKSEVLTIRPGRAIHQSCRYHFRRQYLRLDTTERIAVEITTSLRDVVGR